MNRDSSQEPFHRVTPHTAAHAKSLQRSRGFTLLELILALILMATMLVLTWNLMGAFKTQLEAGAQQSEEWQVIRAVQQTLKRDLRAVQKPVPRQAQTSALESNGEGAEDIGEAVDSTESSVNDEESSTVDGESSEPATPQPPSMRSIFESESNSENNFQGATNSNGSQASSDSFTYSLEDEGYDSNGGESSDSAIPTATDLFVEAKNITHQAWRADEVMFYGTSQALIFDAYRAPEAGQRHRPDREPDMNQAVLPDELRRFVYVFTDPESAILSDRPRGLIRVQLTPWQRRKLSAMTGDQLDLIDLLKPMLPSLATSDAASDPLLSATTNLGGSSGANVDSGQSLLGQDPNARPSAFLGSDQHNQLNFGAHLDYLPEVAVLMFRYYDGSSWVSTWDGRSKGVPVAVELRFQLESEVLKRLRAQGVIDEEANRLEQDSSNTAPTTDRFGASLDPTNAPMLSVDSSTLTPVDESSSLAALTQPPEDHRFLIFLHPREQRRTIEVEGMSPLQRAVENATSDAIPVEEAE